ncbi:hypothetical protein F5Y10DRAFT_292939 [Nemania abortiva]|nr:hypothetical protein F5Y10DRAFT_292939 [Nemania abortiva]
MADRFQLDLKTFELSGRTFGLSLSMTSAAFIDDVPLRNVTKDDLSSLIQSKQLWLLPRGLCRLDVHVQLDECDIIWREEQDYFFEFIADAICQSYLWWQLGLRVEILDVDYYGEEDDRPNLCFSIEQLDMSSALLSPPHTSTAHFKGLECILQFKASSRPEASDIGEDQLDPDAPDLIDVWENAAYLVESALCITFGTRQRIPGLRICELEKAPSLLGLAPAIWNCRYLKSTVSHTKNFAVISNILASSLSGQSPELRRKGAKLLEHHAGASIDPYREPECSTRQLESTIQRMLWNLLQATLKPTIGTNNWINKTASLNAGLDYQYYEIDETIIDGDIDDRYGWSDGYHYPYRDLSLPSSQSDNLSLESPWQQGDNLILPLQDNQVPGAPGFENETEYLCHEAGMLDCQLLDPYSQRAKLDEYDMIQDYVLMSEDMYDEDDDIYDYGYDYTSLMGREPAGYEAEATTASCWELRDDDDTYSGVVESSSDLEVDGGLS